MFVTVETVEVIEAEETVETGDVIWMGLGVMFITIPCLQCKGCL